MANEFIARNGVIALNNSQVSGSLGVSSNINMYGILYDSQNSSYYVKPSGTSQFSAATFGGNVNVGGLSFNAAFNIIGSTSQVTISPTTNLYLQPTNNLYLQVPNGYNGYWQYNGSTILTVNGSGFTYATPIYGTSATFSGLLSLNQSGNFASFGLTGSGTDNYLRLKGTSQNFDIAVRADGTFGIANAGVAYVFTLTNAGAATFSSSVTASSFSGAGTGLTGTASSLTAGNATTWNSQSYIGPRSMTSSDFFLTNQTGTANWGYTSVSSVQAALGLGSNAYTSTAYLPASSLSISANQIAYGNGTNTIAGSSNLTWDTNTFSIKSSSSPSYFISNTAAGTDIKNYDYYVDTNGTLHFRAINDAQTSANDWLTITRSGITISTITLGGALTGTTAVFNSSASTTFQIYNLSATGNGLNVYMPTSSGMGFYINNNSGVQFAIYGNGSLSGTSATFSGLITGNNGYTIADGYTIGLAGNTRYGINRTYQQSVGDMYGIEQISSTQNTNQSTPMLRVFTSSAASAGLSLGKYTSATAFTDFLSFTNIGAATFSSSVTAASVNSKFITDDNGTNSWYYGRDSYLGGSTTDYLYKWNGAIVYRLSAAGALSISSNAAIGGLLTVGTNFVAGTAVAQGYYQDNNNGAYRALSGATNPGFYFQSYNGGSTSMYVGLSGTYGGMIGIGTVTPSYNLHVVGTGYFSGALSSGGQIRSYQTGGGSISGLVSQGIANYDLSGGTDAKYWDIIAGSNNLLFRAVNDANSAANNWLSVSRSGYSITGITLGAALSGTSATFSSSVTATDFIKSYNYLAVNKNGSNSVGSGPYVVLAETSTSKQALMQLNASQGLDFWFYNGTSWLDAITFTNTGNVGIGTTNPSYTFTTIGTGYFSSILTVTGTIYDGSNTSYYVKPSGFSQFNQVAAGGKISANSGLTGAGNPSLYVLGDILVNRDANHGVVYFGTSEHAYMYWDGTNYYFGDSAYSPGLVVPANGRTTYGPNTTWSQYLIVGGNGIDGSYAQIAATNGNLHLESLGATYPIYLNYYRGGSVYMINASTSLYLGGTFYDNANTAYYLKPSGVSQASQLYLNYGQKALSFNNGTANSIAFPTNGLGAPTFTSYSAGVKIILWDSVGTGSAGYTIGMNGNTMWFGTDTTASGYAWYAGTTSIATLSGGGTFTATGDVVAYSDASIKTNVRTVENALEKTMKMRGVTYNRIDIADKSEKVGVIAQEIREVLPQVVTEAENGILAVSYGNIVGVLIEAIKEQQKQIEELKAKLN